MPKGKIKDPAIGAMLRELRKQKGAKSPQAFSEMMEKRYSVAGILRRESGDIALDFNYLEHYCHALNLNEEEKEQLFVKAKVSQLKSKGDNFEVRNLYVELFKESYKQNFYAGSHLPISLWTLDYASAVLAEFFTIKNTESEAKIRVENGRRMREDVSKRVRVACHEGALYMPHGSPQVMINQLNFLLELEDSPHFEFRILPSDVFLKVSTAHVFTTLDDRYTFTESLLGMTTSEDPQMANSLDANFDEIWTNSYIGIKRNRLIEKAIEHFKKML